MPFVRSVHLHRKKPCLGRSSMMTLTRHRHNSKQKVSGMVTQKEPEHLCKGHQVSWQRAQADGRETSCQQSALYGAGGWNGSHSSLQPKTKCHRPLWVTFRGRCPLRQYMPSKPVKCDNKTGTARDGTSLCARRMQMRIAESGGGLGRRGGKQEMKIDKAQGPSGRGMWMFCFHILDQAPEAQSEHNWDVKAN